MLEAMQDDKASFGNSASYLYSLTGPLARHPVEILYQAVLSICDMWIMLDIGAADIQFDRFAGLAIVEHQLIKRDHIRFVTIMGLATTLVFPYAGLTVVLSDLLDNMRIIESLL